MTDVILQANDQSPLINTLKNSDKLSDFYTTRQQYNALSTGIQYVKTDPKVIPTSTFHSKQVVFDVPKNGLWCNSFIEASITTGATDVHATLDGTHIGARFFQRLDLIAHGSIIASVFPEALHMLCDTLPFEKATQLQSLLNGTTTSYSGANAVILYIPLALFCFDNTFNYLETRFMENLTVSGVINTYVGMGLSEVITACSLKLISQYRVMTEPALKSYKAFMYPENKRRQMLMYDFATETPKALEAASDATGSDILLTCPNIATRTYFYVNLVASNVGPTRIGRIKTFSITLNGVKVAETVPVEFLKLEDASQGGSYVNVSQAGEVSKLIEGIDGVSLVTTFDKFRSGYVINWGQFAGSAMNSYSSGVSLMNCSNPTLNITVDTALDDTTYEARVVHSFLKVLSVDVTGKISITNAL